MLFEDKLADKEEAFAILFFSNRLTDLPSHYDFLRASWENILVLTDEFITVTKPGFLEDKNTRL